MNLGEILIVYSIAAIGLGYFSYGSNQLAFSQSAMMAIGAYIMAISSNFFLDDLSTYYEAVLFHSFGLILGVLMATVVAIALIYPALKLKGPYFAMVTIAFAWVCWKILVEGRPVTGGDLGIRDIEGLRAQYGLANKERYIFFLIIIGLTASLFLFLKRSSFELVRQGLREDTLALSAMGYNVKSTTIFLFTICSIFGAIAGSLYTLQISYINPQSFDVIDAVFILMAVLIGGARSITGAIIGAFVIFVLPEFLHGLQQYRLLFYSAFLIFALHFLPKGIVGFFKQKDGVHISPKKKIDDESLELFQSKNISVSASGFSKSYENIQALQDASLTTFGGEIFGVIGLNGSGKSTFLDTMTGLIKPDSGTALLNSSKTLSSDLSQNARNGVLRSFQSARNFKNLTCRDNVLLGVLAKRKRNQNISLRSLIFDQITERDVELANSYLIEFELDNFADINASELSEGHSKILEVVRIMAAAPDVLLLDEPTSGANPSDIELLKSAISKFKNQKRVIILVDHDIEFMRSVCDQGLVLNAGNVVATGRFQDLLNNPEVQSLYFGESR